MVITAVSYPGERLERSGRAFVMDRICMHTPRLSLHSGYEQTRHSHTHSEAHFLFFPLNLMVENSAAAHTLFHWASCHLKPVLTASVLRITSTHTHIRTQTHRYLAVMCRHDDAFCTYFMLTVLACLMQVNETWKSQTNQTPPTPTPLGLNVVVRQWRCIDRARLSLL